jgi:hypothetical protein
LSVDPLVDQTGQPYGYAGGNPVNNVDPKGSLTAAASSTYGERSLGPCAQLQAQLNRLLLQQFAIYAYVNDLPAQAFASWVDRHKWELIGGAAGASGVLAISGVICAAGGCEALAGSAAVAAAEAALSGSGEEAVAGDTASEIDVEGLQFTATVEQHASELTKAGVLSRPYLQSSLTIQNIISAVQPVTDPGGVEGALRWDAPGTLNGTQGTWELVIDTTTNRILHFNFVGG